MLFGKRLLFIAILLYQNLLAYALVSLSLLKIIFFTIRKIKKTNNNSIIPKAIDKDCEKLKVHI